MRFLGRAVCRFLLARARPGGHAIVCENRSVPGQRGACVLRTDILSRMSTFEIITKEDVARAVYEAIPRIACELPADVRAALEDARKAEGPTRGAFVLDQLIENARIAAADRVPICQDTGTVWVCLEAGPDVLVPGDVFADVDDAVARAYEEARLRKSVVRDALFDRTNTLDNTPAFTDVHFVKRPGARVHVMLKGGGSDNASRVVMLAPGAGREGVVREIMDCVREKAANACPPLVIGIGVGSTFDKVAHLAKSALLRPVGRRSQDERVAVFERELLGEINALGLGPGALGGKTLALDVHVETAPCHIAALPLAINMGCSAMRRATIELAAVASIEPHAVSEACATVAQDEHASEREGQ